MFLISFIRRPNFSACQGVSGCEGSACVDVKNKCILESVVYFSRMEYIHTYVYHTHLYISYTHVYEQALLFSFKLHMHFMCQLVWKEKYLKK